MGKTRDLFKKIRDTTGTFHAKMGSIKDRNGMDLTEAEDIKKRLQKFEFDSFLFFWHFECLHQKSPYVVLVLIPTSVITSVLDFQATGLSFDKDPD